MNYNLLVNNYSEDTPAIAVIKDVNLKKLDSFISTLELVLQEHYCVNTVTFANGFPNDISSEPFPIFFVDFKVTEDYGDTLWDGQVEISCIPIYDCPLNDDPELDKLNMDCGVSNNRSKLLTND